MNYQCGQGRIANCQILPHPKINKETSRCENAMFKVGASCMQGWRLTMEDSHTCYLYLPGDRTSAYFSVFDGHGGAKTSRYASLNLHSLLVMNKEYIRGNIEEGLRQSFLALDKEMQMDRMMQDDLSGTTACVCLVRGNKIFCSNAGDSRAVASRHGDAIPLSTDHKPDSPIEYQRIRNAGGFVEASRVNGNLAVSRALGDFTYKRNTRKSQEEQVVTANPEITIIELHSDIEFLVLACDGIWDVLTSQQVVDFVRERIAKGYSPERICEELMMRCLAPSSTNSYIGCDNMTVMIVLVLQGSPLSSLQQRCSKPRSSIDCRLIN